MQDFREMVNGGVGVGGGGARVFAGDRRTRLLPPNQALKCPRCDSINTKFCYYNNYNLSQPRHFCKNCRRYWTKGGVLRNVPVGGGCRKAKRSKTKANSRPNEEMKSTSSHSSSESSSHTATTTTTTTTTNEAASALSSWSSVPTAATEGLLNFRDSSLFPSHNPNLNTDFEPPLLDNLEQTSDGGIFPEIGSFSSLLTASNPTCLGFNFSDISPFRFHHPEPDQKINMSEEMKLPELTAGFMDQTAPDNLAEMQGRNATEDGRRLTELDWPRSGDPGLYNLGSSVDQTYWNQNQCSDTDQPLYIP